MKKQRHHIFLALLLLSCSNTSSLSFQSFEFHSDYVEKRKVTILLPPSYHRGDKKYPVLYMHDGQMLFDSTNTWNGKEWGVDETLIRLWNDNLLDEIIVVGIDNGGSSLRHPEYFPQKPFEQLSNKIQDSLYRLFRYENVQIFPEKIKSNSYLRFLVYELKPHVDSLFRTKKDRSNTFIAGSSMGGLISIYAICEYPEVFGGAACMSTHWPGIFTVKENPIPQEFFQYLATNLPNPATHKLYFDIGTETLDSMYLSLQPVADSIIRIQGYTDEKFLTRIFEGDSHDENAWKNRLVVPLKFLLEK